MSRTIGIWMSDKKSSKFNWDEFTKTCWSNLFSIIKVDLDRPLEDQGKIDVFLHKLTDVIAAADQGNFKAMSIINRVEQYLSNHPNTIVIDPLDNVRILLNRYHYYSILDAQSSFKMMNIFTPAFAEFTTNNDQEKLAIMHRRGVRFPVICKPTIAHGSKSAHEMIVVFNKTGLSVCKPPCVVQSFVNHDAVLHKVFLVGKRYHIVERPSLKNFYANMYLNPIFYSTGEVCKADSQSSLSILDPHDQDENNFKRRLDKDKIEHIIKVLEKEIGLILAGFDVVIDNVTGHHAVIDINVFPSYDNFPNFFDHLLYSIEEKLETKNILYCEDNNGLNELINVGSNTGLIKVAGMNI